MQCWTETHLLMSLYFSGLYSRQDTVIYYPNLDFSTIPLLYFCLSFSKFKCIFDKWSDRSNESFLTWITLVSPKKAFSIKPNLNELKNQSRFTQLFLMWSRSHNDTLPIFACYSSIKSIQILIPSRVSPISKWRMDKILLSKCKWSRPLKTTGANFILQPDSLVRT